MTATQLMQATGKLADDKQWREMFGGGAPGGSQADQAANDRGGWARPTVLPGVTATPGAPAPTAGGQGGYGSAIAGIGLGADYGLPPSILADVINSKEGGDTQGKTGTYFGLWALSTKLATAIGAALSLPVVAWLGFNPEKNQYSTSALIIVYIGLPVAIKIIAALLIWFVRIEASRGAVREAFAR